MNENYQKTYQVNQIVKTITNTDFYFMIENQVRRRMMEFEESVLLPKMKKVIEDVNINENELRNYEPEGYYYKTEKLKKYFSIIKNLQENDSIFDKFEDYFSDEFSFVKEVVENHLFGKHESNRFEAGRLPILRKRIDSLHECMIKGFDNNLLQPWSIGGIMEKLDDYKTGIPGLVELAILTKDPICLTCGSETNILYREIANVTGCFIPVSPIWEWKVSEDVEYMGRRVVYEYNLMFNSNFIKCPRSFDHAVFDKEPELPRVARIGKVLTSDENYYWILDRNKTLVDKYTDESLTTQNYL